ncbi:MAG: hypothetical protein V4580_09275, partial [Bacteroidota bacterium]
MAFGTDCIISSVFLIYGSSIDFISEAFYIKNPLLVLLIENKKEKYLIDKNFSLSGSGRNRTYIKRLGNAYS